MVEAIFSSSITGSLIAQAQVSANSFINNPAIIFRMFMVLDFIN
jgi:hypothetical protein